MTYQEADKLVYNEDVLVVCAINACSSMVECLAPLYCLLWDYISSSAYTVYNDYDTKKQVFSESGVGSNLTVQQHCSHIHHILFIYFQSMSYETEYL